MPARLFHPATPPLHTMPPTDSTASVEASSALSSRQQLLQRQWPQAREIHARHGFDPGRLDELAALVDHFEIRVPLIGAFSCGKSSLLNALLGENLLATAVTPETAVPAELRFGTERHLAGRLPDGRSLPLSAADLRESRLAPLLDGGWVAAQLPCPVLAARPQLVLVDLPGWDSGVAAHERVIDDYASRSLAYGVVVSVEEGGLRDSLRRALLELAIAQMPVVLIVSKADKRTPEDVQAVVARLGQDVTALMGRAPLAVAVTSARKKHLGALESALDILQDRASDLFEARVVAPYRRQLAHAAQHLRLLASQDHQDGARIQADIDKLEQDLRAFDARMRQESDALQAQIPLMLGTIRQRVENALGERLERLTDRAMNGQDIRDDMLGTARLVVAEALRQEFEPVMRRYLDRLVDALPSRLEVQLDLGRLPLDGGAEPGGEFAWKTLAAALAPLLVVLPQPIGKLLGPVLTLLGELFGGQADEQRREVAQARQREQVRQRIHAALGDVVGQIEARLQTALNAQVQQAQTDMARHIGAERDEVTKTLTTLAASLQQGEAEAAALRERARHDLDRVNTLLTALGPAA